MFLDENEVIPFQKSPWNALCKSGILLKKNFFKPKFEDDFVNQTSNHPHFCTLNSPLMLQKSYGTLFKNSKDPIELQRKSSFSRKLQNSSYELDQRLFYQKLVLIQYFDSSCIVMKRNWVSTLLSSEMYGLSIRQGLTLSHMVIYQVFL